MKLVVEEIATPLSIAEQWRNLLSRSSTSTIYQSPEWICSWYEAFKSSYEPLFLVARRGDSVVAIAALAVSSERLNGIPERVIDFAGSANYCSDFADYIYDPANTAGIRAIIKWLERHRELWSVQRFRNLPANSPTVQLIQSANRFPTRVQSEVDAPTCILGDEKYEKSLVNKKSLKRHTNYFKRNGEVRFEYAKTTEDLECFLEGLFEQHIARWANTDTPSQFLDPEQKRFFQLSAHQLLQCGSLRLSRVVWNDRAIAYHFGFESKGRYIWYKPSYDPELAKKSPGEVLIRFLLQDATENGYSEFDFTVGNEPFKYRYANLIRKNLNIFTFARRASLTAFNARLALSTSKQAVLRRLKAA